MGAPDGSGASASFGTGGGEPSGTGAFGSGGFGSGGLGSGGLGSGASAGSGGQGVLHAPDARLEPPVFCTIDGWCGSNADFLAIAGTSQHDLWIIAHDTGDLDAPSPALVPNQPERTALLHWTGLAWDVWPVDASILPPGGRLRSAWAASPDDVWAVGDAATVLHFDGSDWTSSQLPFSTHWASVSGGGPSDVWVVGAAGAIAHYDGSSWEGGTYSTTNPMTGVAGRAGALWIVGLDTILHESVLGEAVSVEPNPEQFQAIFAPNDDSAFAVGKTGVMGRWDGTAWSVYRPDSVVDPLELRGVWAAPHGLAWGVGTHGSIVRFDESGWEWSYLHPDINLNAVWGVPGFTWVVGDQGRFLQLFANEWRSSRANDWELRALWGGAPDDVWAVGDEFVHWDGRLWRNVPDPGESEILAIWGTSVSDVWAVGRQGTIVHWDGHEWAQVESPTSSDITGVWGTAAESTYAVDAAGDILRLEAGAWSVVLETTETWRSIGGNAAGQMLVAGETALYLMEAGALTELQHPAAMPSYGVVFGDGETIWAGGGVGWGGFNAGGVYPELDSWRAGDLQVDLEPPSPAFNLAYNPIMAGWASSPSDVWIALPWLMHWDGAGWRYVTVGGSEQVRALFGTSTDLWALTDSSGIIRRSLP